MAEEKPDALQAPENFPGRYITPIFTNQFYLVVAAQTTRITLGEIVFLGQEPNYTSALVMPTDMAIDMAQKILRLAKEQGFLKDESQEHVVLKHSA